VLLPVAYICSVKKVYLDPLNNTVSTYIGRKMNFRKKDF